MESFGNVKEYRLILLSAAFTLFCILVIYTLCLPNNPKLKLIST